MVCVFYNTKHAHLVAVTNVAVCCMFTNTSGDTTAVAPSWDVSSVFGLTKDCSTSRLDDTVLYSCMRCSSLRDEHSARSSLVRVTIFSASNEICRFELLSTVIDASVLWSRDTILVIVTRQTRV